MITKSSCNTDSLFKEIKEVKNENFKEVEKVIAGNTGWILTLGICIALTPFVGGFCLATCGPIAVGFVFLIHIVNSIVSKT